MPDRNILLDENNKPKLKRKPDVLVKVKCNNGFHRIAIIKDKLVLIDHHRPDCDQTMCILGGRDPATYFKCNTIHQAYKNYITSGYYGRGLPDKILAYADAHKKVKEFRQVEKSSRKVRLANLIGDLIAKKLGKYGIKTSVYLNRDSVSRFVDRHVYSVVFSNGYNYKTGGSLTNILSIDMRSGSQWLKNVYKNNLVITAGKLVLMASPIQPNLYEALITSENAVNIIKRLEQTANAYQRFKIEQAYIDTKGDKPRLIPSEFK